MNYSLSSARKIGNYWQKIITTQLGAAKATSSSYLTGLKAWHTLLASLDYSGRSVGTISYKTFTETDGEGTSNTGTKADGTFVVLSLGSGNPKTVTIQLKNETTSTLAASLNSACTRLIGSNVNTVNNYLVSANIKLH